MDDAAPGKLTVSDLDNRFFVYRMGIAWKPHYGMAVDVPGSTTTFSTADALNMFQATKITQLRNGGWPENTPLEITPVHMISLRLSFNDIARLAAQANAPHISDSPFAEIFRQAAEKKGLRPLGENFIFSGQSIRKAAREAAFMNGRNPCSQITLGQGANIKAALDKVNDPASCVLRIADPAQLKSADIRDLHRILATFEFRSPAFTANNDFTIASLYCQPGKTQKVKRLSPRIASHSQTDKPLYAAACALDGLRPAP